MTPDTHAASVPPAEPGAFQGDEAAFRAWHQGQVHADNRLDPPLNSVAARLHAAHPRVPLVIDRHHRPRLITTPPIFRARMLPTPLARNLFVRAARWLKRKWFGLRGQLRVHDGIPSPAATPDRPWHRAGARRRTLLLSLVLLQSAAATWCMSAILPYHGTHLLEAAILIIFPILSAWVSAGFWTAMMGVWVLARGRDRYAISASDTAHAPLAADARTAILVPICNEDVARVFAGLRATYDSLKRAGGLAHFDFFILSDTSDPDLRVAEMEAWVDFCEHTGGFGHVYYRRRQHRIKRKSGNIADFCRRWGSHYRYMVVLDADSVMSGPTLIRLAQLMEANPGAGIIQTAPQSSGRESLYARIQQFANRVYGPLFTAGLHFWQLGESHYWGHNAILRVAPFIAHCALGKLPGRGPLAGEILSHDFVEAALMRRAGWAVWMAYDLPGSHEEMPPTLLDELQRDRRWCQGNLQNFRLFLAQGLHPAHRAVFMTGVMAYLSSPLWFLFLALSTALLAVYVLVEPQYFAQPEQLFPIWPEWRPEWAIALFAATASLLFLPKILAVLRLMLKPQDARFYGGRSALALSLLLESLFSALLAPIKMLFHTVFVVTTLGGFAVNWRSPPREDAETPWRQAITRHGPGTALGVLWATGVYFLNPAFLNWLLPVAGSLIVAIPLSVWSSRVSLGRWFRQRRLFLIPEEANPPRELRWTRAALRRAPDRDHGFIRACVDPAVNALVCALGRPRSTLAPETQAARLRRIEEAIRRGPDVLSATERNVLLSDPYAMSRLHLLAQTSPVLHPDWRRAA